MTIWRKPQDLERQIGQRFSDFRAFKKRHAKGPRFRPALLATAGVIGLMTIAGEVRTSALQAAVFSVLAEGMKFHVAAGGSTAIHFPKHGPFDEQRGYTRIPHFITALKDRGYEVERQARMSPLLASFQRIGGFPPYDEKDMAGLTLVSDSGRAFYAPRYPATTYARFEAVPDILAKSLLFIENRELLDDSYPRRNPAVEWDRLGLAMFKFGASEASGGNRPGGSTLATQLEKIRHSPDGLTSGPGEKLGQMVSASLRAYREGPDTTQARHRIVVKALDSMPLAGFPGHGAVTGLGDGLRLWYGTDFATANRLLAATPANFGDSAKKAQVFKQALSLIVAQRRPSYFLHRGRHDLEALTNSYLRLMAASGIIDERLRDRAIHAPLRFRATVPEAEAVSPNMTKAVSAMRVDLLKLLRIPSLYDLDRLDMTGETTLDAKAQEQITAMLHSLNEPENLAALGLLGPRLLKGVQPARVAYSFTLFERGATANLLRVQTDSVDRPLDLNVGTKMELGSTAKVRTLITYLEIIADLYEQNRSLPAPRLEALQENGDPLSKWVAGELLEHGDTGLSGILQAAMDRTYLAGSGERFFTAGGAHRFANFNRKFGGGKIPVAKALEQSVNLVFIRMMRDIVDYHVGRLPGAKALAEVAPNPARTEYLRRFADMEGRQYMWRFYPEYRGLGRDAILARIALRAKYLRPRLAAAYRTVLPNADYQRFSAFIDRWAEAGRPSDEEMQRLYETYAPDRLNLADRSYVSGIHPLELWLAGYLYAHPKAGWKDIVAASAGIRQESYGWLFKSNRLAAQNRRIRTLLEQEAFVPIHKSWKRLGYPFDHLIPSYATAIGTSGDRPDALAELMGIIVNDGVKLPTVRFEKLRFAEGTPYESVVEATPAPGRQVLRPEIARIVRTALLDVVENGTARRASGALSAPDGSKLPIGAKTGTGDNRTQQFGRGGRLIGSTVRSRTATLMFFIDDRFFGTITAHVDGPEAGQYRFTSALPAQLFKSLAPVLQPMVLRPMPERRPAVRVASLAAPTR